MKEITEQDKFAAKVAVELFHEQYGHLVVSDQYELYQEIYANAFYFGREYAVKHECLKITEN